MNRIHTLILVLLLVAVPFKAAMAVSGMLCVFADHHGAAASVHGHHEDNTHVAHAHGFASTSDKDGAQIEKACGVCASCCSQAAVAPTVFAVNGEWVSQSEPIFTPTSQSEHIPSGLQRPPRLS